MKGTTKHVGLDVSKATIAVAVADAEGGAPRYWGQIANTPEAVRKLMTKLGDPQSLQVCYEAGPTGYGLYRQLCDMGIQCIVVAPSLIPVRAGDQVKTDRRDALRLAQLLRAGELTAVWVPDDEHEGLRDLVRARESAKRDLRRARQALSSFLLRQGKVPPIGTRRWAKMFMRWLDTLSFEVRSRQVAFIEMVQAVREADARVERLEAEIHAVATQGRYAPLIQALQALKGVREIVALTLAAEIGRFSRFRSPASLMAYAGVVPREASSGARTHRGGITKTGNAHVRFVLGEAAWAYRYNPGIKAPLRKRHEGLDPEVIRIALKAQERLHRTYRHLINRGKPATVATTAVARELLGFAWAIASYIENRDEAAAA